MPTVLLYAGWHQISLWTRTNPIRNLCVWVRVWMYDCAHVFCTVVVKVHVAAFFVDDWRSWPLRGKTELLESVSCAIKASFLPLSGGLPLCPKQSVPTSPTTMSFIKTSAEGRFQLRVSHISTWSLPVLQPPSSYWWPKGNSPGGNALFYHGKAENNSWLSEHHWPPVVFLRYQDIPSSLLCIIFCWSVCESYSQFNVNRGQVGESSLSIMCTNTALMF